MYLTTVLRSTNHTYLKCICSLETKNLMMELINQLFHIKVIITIVVNGIEPNFLLVSEYVLSNKLTTTYSGGQKMNFHLIYVYISFNNYK